MHAFDNVVSGFFECQINNLKELATLSNLRDTLLPRLISGALRLPEVEAQIQEAAT
jgi:type I restriction enzyme S subunit